VLYREAHTLVEALADAQLAGTRQDYVAAITTVPLLIMDVGSGNSDPSFSGNFGRSQALTSGSSRVRRATKRRPERGRGDRRHDPA
jgi:hypothetical protein